MDISIMTLERQFVRGAEAARSGASRDDHNMNPGAHGVETWQAGYDHVMKLRTKPGVFQQRGEP